jgi:hypothetical protein
VNASGCAVGGGRRLSIPLVLRFASVLFGVLLCVVLVACNDQGEIPGENLGRTPAAATASKSPVAATVSKPPVETPSVSAKPTRRGPGPNEIPGVTTFPSPRESSRGPGPIETPGVSPTPSPTSLESDPPAETRDPVDRAISLENEALATVPLDEATNWDASLWLCRPMYDRLLALENYQWISSDAEAE